MKRSVLALLLLASLACAHPAAAAERCKLPRGAERIASLSYTRVYMTVTPEGFPGPSYACNRRTGRRFKLDDPDRELVMLGSTVQLAGTHIGYEVRTTVSDIWAYGLYTIDLATAKKRLHGSWTEDDDELLWDFRLVKSGAIAWSEITANAEAGEIWLHGQAGRQRLDTGPPEMAETFGVSQNLRRFYWTNGDEARSALLR